MEQKNNFQFAWSAVPRQPVFVSAAVAGLGFVLSRKCLHLGWHAGCLAMCALPGGVGLNVASVGMR